MKYELLVDINPLGIDVVLADENGQVQNIHTPYEGHDFAVTVLNLDEFLTTVKSAFAHLENILQHNDEIQQVYFKNIMNGWMALDENFNPLTPILMGKDTDAHFIEALMMNGIGGQLQRKTGVPLAVTLPLIITLRLKNEEPEIYAHAAHYMTLREYMVYLLFGQNTTDAAFAARTGFYNTEYATWDGQALALTGLRVEQLPDLVSKDELTGRLDVDWLPEMITDATNFKMY